MANNEFTRLGRRVIQYIIDPLQENHDPAPIWCLGRRYTSPYRDSQSSPVSSASTGNSGSDASQADSAVVAEESTPTDKTSADRPTPRGPSDSAQAEEEALLGWPAEFLDDLESKIWLTYRSNFPAIPRSSHPQATAHMSLTTKLRNLGNKDGFTSDTGWGCMIRSGQSLLANALTLLRFGRDWRLGEREEEYRELLGLFADVPQAPFSIHRFVEHGAQACGKHPGEWFGPSATARCIQALAPHSPTTPLRVYARPDDNNVYLDTLLATATAPDTSTFHPTLILLGTRLGIDRITPTYHAALLAALELPHSVGIAGGRPGSSHYFVGHQGSALFYLDPHTTRPALPAPPVDPGAARPCHTRRVRALRIADVDPSMLVGFVVRTRAELEAWRLGVEAAAAGGGKAVVQVHEREPRYASGIERAGAVDEVETWDDGGV